MTDKELIKQEIEKLIAIEEETSNLDKISFNSGRWKALTQMKAFIESIPEEPAVKGITWEDINTLESLIYQVHNEYPSIGEKSFGLEVLERFQDCQDDIEEPASEDLEEETDRFEEWLNSYNQSDYPTSYTVRDIARHFAEWQKQKDFEELLKSDMSQFKKLYEKGRADMKEEMMKDSISCNVDWYDGFRLDYTQEQQDDILLKLGADVGDKVKIIIVKND